LAGGFGGWQFCFFECALVWRVLIVGSPDFLRWGPFLAFGLLYGVWVGTGASVVHLDLFTTGGAF